MFQKVFVFASNHIILNDLNHFFQTFNFITMLISYWKNDFKKFKYIIVVLYEL